MNRDRVRGWALRIAENAWIVATLPFILGCLLVPPEKAPLWLLRSFRWVFNVWVDISDKADALLGINRGGEA